MTETNTEKKKVFRSIPSFHRRSGICKVVQTEASFPLENVNTNEHYERLASEQFQDLVKLRDVIRGAMKEVACSVYDVVAFKDVLFKMEDDLPSKFPVTDMLLLSSKLFRRTSELGRLLGCFFAVVFADGHSDDDFHFTELRVLRRELLDIKKQFTKAEGERIRLQRMLDDINKVAMNHSKSVDLLESRNMLLQLQTNGLEDQMALLFSQLNKDMHNQYKEAYERVTHDINSQDHLNLTRATFRQTMDSLSDQLKHSCTLINEVRELVISCAQSDTSGGRNVDAQISKEPSIRFKLKQIDNNFQQLISRFASIKSVVAEAGQELMVALQERKNILYLTLQHIRLYDIQNTKMRRSKAIIMEQKRSVEELMKRVGVTFPSGAVTFVDRIGRISTQQWQVGQTLATIRNQKTNEPVGEEADAALNMTKSYSSMPHLQNAMDQTNDDRSVVSSMEGTMQVSAESGRIPFQTIFNIVDILTLLERSMEKLNGTLNFENELNAFLKTLTLPLSTTPRDAEDNLGQLTDLEEAMERALVPTGNTGAPGQGISEPLGRRFEEGSDGLLGSSIHSLPFDEQEQSVAGERMQRVVAGQDERIRSLQEQLDKVQPEFVAKANFLRQVYEARICDLELKEANCRRRFNIPSPSKNGSEQKETKERGESKKRRGPAERERPLSRSVDLSASERRRKKDDKEQLAQSRSEWQQTKQTLQGNTKVRETTLSELDKMMKESINDSKSPERIHTSQSKGAGRSRASMSSR